MYLRSNAVSHRHMISVTPLLPRGSQTSAVVSCKVLHHPVASSSTATYRTLSGICGIFFKHTSHSISTSFMSIPIARNTDINGTLIHALVVQRPCLCGSGRGQLRSREHLNRPKFKNLRPGLTQGLSGMANSGIPTAISRSSPMTLSFVRTRDSSPTTPRCSATCSPCLNPPTRRPPPLLQTTTCAPWSTCPTLPKTSGTSCAPTCLEATRGVYSPSTILYIRMADAPHSVHSS